MAQQVPDLLPVKENNLWGLIDRNGNIRLAPLYGYLSSFDLNGYAICEINGKKGLLDTSATVRLDAAYDLITCLNSQFYLLMNDSLWQFYDLSTSCLSDTFLCEGKVIPVTAYAFKASEGNHWGLIDKGGNWVVRPLYDEITSASSCLSLRMNDSILLLDSNYNEILSGKFEVAYADKGIICTRHMQSYKLFSDKGKKIISDLDRITVYNNYITCGKNGKTGVFYLPSHTLISEPVYDSIFYVDGRFWGYMETGKCGILDSLGKIIIPGIYDKIRYIQGFFCLRMGGYWGIAGESGEIILECLYESISLIDRNLIEIEKNSLYGLANTSGKILVNCSAGRIIYRDGMAKIYRDSTVTIAEISEEGEITGKTVCKSVGTISIDEDNTRRPVFSTNNSLSAEEKSWGSWFFSEERKKYGLKNNTDEVIITPRYGEVHVNNNLRLTLTEAKRRQDNITLSGAILSENLPKYGLVDHIRGKILQPAVWEKIYINDLNLGYRFIRCAKTVRSRMSCIRPFDNGAVFQENVLFTGKISDSLIRVCIGGKITSPYTHPRESISVSGTGLAGFSSFDGRRSSTTMIYIENGRWVFWDTDGYQAVNGVFSYADDFINGTAIVKKDNKWGITNRDTVIVPFEYDNITRLEGSDDSLFCLYLRKWNCGILDEAGNIIFKSNYQDIRYANESLLLIKEGNKWGYAELNGTIVVNPVFSKAGVFSEGLAPVKYGRMWGYISTEGDMAIEPAFSRAGEFHEGLAWVKTSRKSGYIDPYGNFAIEGKYTSGSDFHNGMAIVSQKMKFGVIDKKGNWLVKPRYRYVSGFSEGLAVFGKNKKYFFADSTGKRMIKRNFEDAHPFYE
ncbi:MAG: WG repeat-containing protein, partial [Bacteroidota bacterium]